MICLMPYDLWLMAYDLSYGRHHVVPWLWFTDSCILFRTWTCDLVAHECQCIVSRVDVSFLTPNGVSFEAHPHLTMPEHRILSLFYHIVYSSPSVLRKFGVKKIRLTTCGWKIRKLGWPPTRSHKKCHRTRHYVAVVAGQKARNQK